MNFSQQQVFALANDMKQGTFEMSRYMGRDDYGRPIYQLTTEECWLLGPFAIHLTDRKTTRWRISHAQSGRLIPGTTGLAFDQACALAAELRFAIDWSKITRGTAPEQAAGVTDAMASRVRSVVNKFTLQRLAPA